MNIENLFGQEVNLIGVAKNAKGGAVLIISDNFPIYIKGLDSWSSDLLDKQITVSGIVKKEKIIPDPIIDENGAISCGAIGEQLVLYKIQDPKIV